MQIGSAVQIRFDAWSTAPIAGTVTGNIQTSEGVTTADVMAFVDQGSASWLTGVKLDPALSANNTFKVISNF